MNMRCLRRTFCVVVVLATAASTLLANTPLVLVCACSTRATQKTSLVPQAEAKVCCCGGDCCPGQSEESPCCKKTSSPEAAQPDRENSPQGPAIQAAHCLKTVFTSEQFLLSERDIVNAGEPLAQPVLFFTSIQDHVQPILAGLQLDWEIHRLPPPTDLVVVLQHFVI